MFVPESEQNLPALPEPGAEAQESLAGCHPVRIKNNVAYTGASNKAMHFTHLGPAGLTGLSHR